MRETEVLEGDVVEGQGTLSAKHRWLASKAHERISTLATFEDQDASDIAFMILEAIAEEAVKDALQRMEAVERRHQDGMREVFSEFLRRDDDGQGYYKPDETENVFERCFM